MLFPECGISLTGKLGLGDGINWGLYNKFRAGGGGGLFLDY